MLRTILKYGVIAGLVVGGFELVTFTAFSGMPKQGSECTLTGQS